MINEDKTNIGYWAKQMCKKEEKKYCRNPYSTNVKQNLVAKKNIKNSIVVRVKQNLIVLLFIK